MNSRIEKYYSEDDNIAKRTSKNQKLYEEINDNKIDKFPLNSNIQLLEDNAKTVHVDRIKEMLDRKYSETPKRKSIILDEEDDLDLESAYEEETKEYDINTILAQARENKELDYSEDRLKKLRDTQFDILTSLKLEKQRTSKKDIEEKPSEEDNLMNLINTITELEMKNQSESNSNPLDILTDLKGDDNTEVLDGIKEKLEEYSDTTDKLKLKDNSFYTTSMDIKKEDFEDFEDLKNEVKANKTISIILILFVILCLLGGLIFLADKVFDIGLF